METLHPSLIMSNSSLLSKRTEWTREENKRFESAIVIYDENEPDRWKKVAAMIPGKTVYDVIKQYKELVEDISDIEAGRFPFPGYLSSSFSFELVDDRDFDAYRKRSLTAKNSEQERKRGVPWTEDEHRRFLLGLMKHGKGDWRNISRNFVVSKTPTQVASHAQKYFIRQQVSGAKEKRRPSIHDITTVNLSNNPLLDNKKQCSSLDQSNFVQQKSTEKMLVDSTTHGNFFVSSTPYEMASNGLMLDGQNGYAEGYNHGIMTRIRPYGDFYF